MKKKLKYILGKYLENFGLDDITDKTPLQVLILYIISLLFAIPVLFVLLSLCLLVGPLCILMGAVAYASNILDEIFT